jgi:hypothetical protein
MITDNVDVVFDRVALIALIAGEAVTVAKSDGHIYLNNARVHPSCLTTDAGIWWAVTTAMTAQDRQDFTVSSELYRPFSITTALVSPAQFHTPVRSELELAEALAAVGGIPVVSDAGDPLILVRVENGIATLVDRIEAKHPRSVPVADIIARYQLFAVCPLSSPLQNVVQVFPLTLHALASLPTVAGLALPAGTSARDAAGAAYVAHFTSMVGVMEKATIAITSRSDAFGDSHNTYVRLDDPNGPSGLYLDIAITSPDWLRLVTSYVANTPDWPKTLTPCGIEAWLEWQPQGPSVPIPYHPLTRFRCDDDSTVLSFTPPLSSAAVFVEPARAGPDVVGLYLPCSLPLGPHAARLSWLIPWCDIPYDTTPEALEQAINSELLDAYFAVLPVDRVQFPAVTRDGRPVGLIRDGGGLRIVDGLDRLTTPFEVLTQLTAVDGEPLTPARIAQVTDVPPSPQT